MPKPIIGQEIFIVTTGNAARYRTETYTGHVCKVGKKYFEVMPEYWRYSIIFHIDTWMEYEKSNYSANYQAYESEQAYRDEQERDRLYNIIQDNFRYCRRDIFTLDQLRQAVKVLGLDAEA